MITWVVLSRLSCNEAAPLVWFTVLAMIPTTERRGCIRQAPNHLSDEVLISVGSQYARSDWYM